MSDTFTKSIFPWIRKHRLIIMLVVVVIIVPIVTISALYIEKYESNKYSVTEIFGDTEVTSKSKGYINSRFTIDVYAKSITSPTEKDGNLSGGAAVIGVVVTRTSGNLLTEDKVKSKVAFAANWVGYASTATSIRELTNATETSMTVSNLNTKWPKSPIWPITVHHPVLLVYLEWNEKENTSSSAEVVTRKIVLTFSYNEYVNIDTIFT